MFSEILWIIGVYVSLIYIHESLQSLVNIIKAVLGPYFDKKKKLTMIERFGKWAVITGATDGIGKEYALNLADNGLNIVLLARSEQKLKDVSKEIESKYSVQTKYIIADFSNGLEIYSKISKELEGIDVGILVNNVGKMYDYPNEFGNVSEQTIWDMLRINIGAVTMMTRMVVNKMKDNRKGAIVNISSGSVIAPLPYKSVYASSKNYMKNFTLALEYELKPYDVTVQIVKPMFVRTKMNSYSETVMAGNFFIPDVESFGKWAVFTIGKTNNTSGYWTHGIQHTLSKIVPEWLGLILGALMNKRLMAEYHENKNKNKMSN